MGGPITARDPGEAVVRGYLELGLRLGRHLEGFVDCWFGDPLLAAAVAAEPLTDPRRLAADAHRMRAELADSDLCGPRSRLLDAQLIALERTAERLSGRTIPFREEVRRCFGIEVAEGCTDRYAAVHAAISEVVGGTVRLYGRVEDFYDRNRVPEEALLRCARAVSPQVRARVVPAFGLPAKERVEYRLVRNVPWNAFNRYAGRFRSEVSLNCESGRTIAALLVIVTHESYAGHHTEHCLKEAGLVVGRRESEHMIGLINTPQSLMAEGAAELSLNVVLGPGWGPWTADILAAEGVRIDGQSVERMLGLIQRLLPARLDAALMAHEQGADGTEIVECLQRWLLLPRDRAEHMVRFLFAPLWRVYSVTYVAGGRLVRAWLQAAAEQTPAQRYERLLREPLLAGDLEVGPVRSAVTTIDR